MTRASADEPAAAVEHSGCWDGTATGSHTLSIWPLTHPSHTLHTPLSMSLHKPSQYACLHTFTHILPIHPLHTPSHTYETTHPLLTHTLTILSVDIPSQYTLSHTFNPPSAETRSHQSSR